MVIILEVPGYAPAYVWRAHSLREAAQMVAEDAEQAGIMPDCHTAEDWIAWNGNTHAAQCIFESEEEARAALEDAAFWDFPYGEEARAALAEELANFGE